MRELGSPGSVLVYRLLAQCKVVMLVIHGFERLLANGLGYAVAGHGMIA